MPLPSASDLCPEMPQRRRPLCDCGKRMEVRCLKKGGEVFWLCPDCRQTRPINQKQYWAHVKKRDEWEALHPLGGPYDEFERFKPRSSLGEEKQWGQSFPGQRARRPNVRLPKQSDFD
jgi:uncharacterized C2H2 Zn-finger protein